MSGSVVISEADALMYDVLSKENKHVSYGEYVVGSKSFRPDIQKLRQMENAVRDI